MATKGQELKKELTQAFSGLKFSIKTKMVCKGSITEIAVTIKGLKDSDYTISEIKEITNKYHNWDWQTVSGDTNVIVNADEETKEEIDNPVIETIQGTKEETIDNPVVETVEKAEKEIDNPVVKTVKKTKLQSKLTKYQTSLARLAAQLAVTKGNRNKAKIVLSMLEIESSIEFLSSTIKNMQSFKDEVVTLPQPEWLQKLSIPEPTKERVVNTINAIDCKIEKLNNDINGITCQNHNNILNSNPVADTGGIRNQSDSKRQQFDDRLFWNAKNAVNASQERDTLATQKKRYIKDIKERPIFEKALKTGKKSSGESYDRETMQFIKDELKLINDRISKIEFSVTTQKFKKL